MGKKRPLGEENTFHIGLNASRCNRLVRGLPGKTSYCSLLSSAFCVKKMYAELVLLICQIKFQFIYSGIKLL